MTSTPVSSTQQRPAAPPTSPPTAQRVWPFPPRLLDYPVAPPVPGWVRPRRVVPVTAEPALW